VLIFVNIAMDRFAYLSSIAVIGIQFFSGVFAFLLFWLSFGAAGQPHALGQRLVKNPIKDRQARRADHEGFCHWWRHKIGMLSDPYTARGQTRRIKVWAAKGSRLCSGVFC
jgi:hypothetical protein